MLQVNYFACGGVAKYCDEYVCVCVAVSVCEEFCRTTRAIFAKFIVHVRIWLWLGPPLASLRYVMYFWFCG